MLQDATFEIRSYQQADLSVRTATYTEAQALHWQEYHHVLSMSLGVWSFENAEKQRITPEPHWPGLGIKCIKLLQALQENPGHYLSPSAICELTGEDTFLENNNLSARLLHLRKLHHESFRKPHLFLSRRSGGLAVAWHPDRSWLSIERITKNLP